MERFLVAVEIHLKPAALDPQGQAVAAALRSLGHDGVRDVRVGKHLLLQLEAEDASAAEAEAEKMCASLLANPVMETHRIAVTAVRPARRRSRAPGPQAEPAR